MGDERKQKPGSGKPKHAGGRPRKLADAYSRGIFLRRLAKTGSIARTCASMRIDHTTLNAERRRDAAFDAQVREADKRGLARLEFIAYEGALKDPEFALKLLERKSVDYAKQRRGTLTVESMVRVMNWLVNEFRKILEMPKGKQKTALDSLAVQIINQVDAVSK